MAGAAPARLPARTGRQRRPPRHRARLPPPLPRRRERRARRAGRADPVFDDAAGHARLTSACPPPAALDRHPSEGGVSDFWPRNTPLEPAAPARPAPPGSPLRPPHRRPPRTPPPPPPPAALDLHPSEGGGSDFWHRNTALEPASPARPAPSGSSLLSTERRPPRIPAPGDFPEALDQLHHGHPRGLSVRLAGFGGAQYGELVEAMIQFA